jgi:hypothetical protein
LKGFQNDIFNFSNKMHLCILFFPDFFCKLGEKKEAIAKGVKDFLEKMGPKLPYYEEKNLKVPNLDVRS